jgi:hypothetical protein
MFTTEKAPGEIHEQPHRESSEAAPQQLDEPAMLLLKAADHLKRYGWCQGAISEPDGRVCLRGALIAAAGNDPWSLSRGDGAGWPDVLARKCEGAAVIEEADARVEKIVYEHPAKWNNHLGRTAVEVIGVLRRAAGA